MSRGPNAATLLVRALGKSAEEAGCPLFPVQSDWTRWASATFTGARHVLVLAAAPGPALDAWLAELPERDLPMRGHLLADIAVTSVHGDGLRVEIALEALTVEER